MTRYRLPDEPQPGSFASLVVDPLSCLLALMIGGVWLSWPWFVLNSFALGSPTRFKEAAWAFGGLFLSVAYLGVIFQLRDAGIIPEAVSDYFALVVPAFHLAVGYALFRVQHRSFDLYRGHVTDAGALAVVLSMAGSWVITNHLPDFWRIILG